MPKGKGKKDKSHLPKGFAKGVQRVINRAAETKYHDNALAIQTLTTTVGLSDCLVISQGQTDLTRIGDAIQLKSVHLKYTIVAGTGQLGPANCRMMVVQWFDNTVPTGADILANTAANSAVVSDYNMDNIRRHKTLRVLYDKTHVIGSNTTAPAGHSVSKFLKFNKNINYAAGGTSPCYGDIYFVNVSDIAPGAAGTVPLYNIMVRSQYIDL